MGIYLRKNKLVVLIFSITFALSCFVSFIRIASSTTIASKSISEYEIGQIADETIVAERALAPTAENPVSVEKDEQIIRKGFPVTKEQYEKLQKMANSPAYIDYTSFFYSVLFLLLLTALAVFLFAKASLGYVISAKELGMACVCFLLIYTIVSVSVSILDVSSQFSLAVFLPSSFCVFLIAIIFGHRTAINFSIIAAFGVFNASGYMVMPFLYLLGTSLVSVRLVYQVKRRTQMVWVSLGQAFANMFFLLMFKLIFHLSMEGSHIAFLGVAFNGFISAILALGFLTPIELALNTASVFRLMDLSDQNTPILKKMLEVATGTYNHSIMVAALAESACEKIGANALLARVSSYYHDIGKIDNPEYFTENQLDGENIHNDINPSLSVSIIKSHVRRGVEKAKELNLPEPVIRIISEHHGNQVIEWFYAKAKEKDPNVDPSDYSYTENPPSTRESAVVMLADTVEAACKSLGKNPSYSALDNKISDLINAKIAAKQMDNCGLTFQDLRRIHDAFQQFLAGYYHSRVKYPGQVDAEDNVQAPLGPANTPLPQQAKVPSPKGQLSVLTVSATDRKTEKKLEKKTEKRQKKEGREKK
ncbi:MAG: HDIG domain-containing protein [Treponema sp.]|nr:HDIG domain-containing protein [Treponema sp.]